ncbi:MAG: LD-carboxypeptidase [Coprothermobacterota bacterium]|nr:LD-carboxypeptidase [Coprothermobacterota bacterium]
MLKPRQLRQGDTVGLVSPSSGPWKRSELWRGIEALESWGFQVKVGAHAYDHHYDYAGFDADRAADLIWAFDHPGIDAVFCSQGGIGAARLPRLLDFDVIRGNPKIFLGYSDITALHLAIGREAELVTFHGPSLAGFDPESMTAYKKDLLLRALTGNEPLGEIKMADPDKYLLKINPGRVQGPLVGGNLTMVCASLGTPWEIRTEGCILFLEELETEPWQMDHLLTHLLNAGKLQAARGILIGECLDCEPRKLDPGSFNQRSLEDILFELLEPLGCPVLYGLPLGHTKDRATLPLGVAATLDTAEGFFRIDEVATTNGKEKS